MFCGFVDPLFCLSDQKTRPFSGPKNGPTLRLLFVFLTWGAERRGRKIGSFLGGLGPKNETQPGNIRNTFGSRFWRNLSSRFPK